jgi:hypothetical protein
MMSLDGTSGLSVLAGANFTGAGTTNVVVARSGGSSVTINASTTAGGVTIWTTTESPLKLGANSVQILTLTTDGNAKLSADNCKLFFGAGDDANVYYDGSNLNIDSSLVAPSDLKVSCGTDKTVELQESVWRDTNMAGGVLSIIDIAQLRDTFVDEAGADTGIETWGLDVGDGVSGCFELQHDYKEGTALYFHVHWQGKAAPTETDKVKFQLKYTIAREETTLNAATVITIETDFDTQYEFKRSDFASIAGTGLLIGDQFLFRLERIAASADEYGGVALLATVGIHYEVNTLGSRQLSDK